VGVEAAPEREDVQLEELGDLLQERLAVRPQPRVQHRLASPQLEVEDTLKGDNERGRSQTTKHSQGLKVGS